MIIDWPPRRIDRLNLSLVRSVGPISYDTPHTGALRYSDDAPKIPAAAVTWSGVVMVSSGSRITARKRAFRSPQAILTWLSSWAKWVVILE